MSEVWSGDAVSTEEGVSTVLDTRYGKLKVQYHEIEEKRMLSVVYGDINETVPLVRLHSSCIFSEVFGSKHCDCSIQVEESLERMTEHGSGVIVYAYEEGRGIGLQEKIRAMEIQRNRNCDTVEAFKQLGYESPDLREYGPHVSVLEQLGTNEQIKVFSGNPDKINALQAEGFTIVKTEQLATPELPVGARHERRTKRRKMGYMYGTGNKASTDGVNGVTA